MITKPFSLSVLWTIFYAAAWLCVTCLQSECCSSLPEKPEPEGIKKEPPKFFITQYPRHDGALFSHYYSHTTQSLCEPFFIRHEKRQSVFCQIWAQSLLNSYYIFLLFLDCSFSCPPRKVFLETWRETSKPFSL